MRSTGPRRSPRFAGTQKYWSPQVKCQFISCLRRFAGTSGDLRGVAPYTRARVTRDVRDVRVMVNISYTREEKKVPAGPRKSRYAYDE